MDVIRVLVVLAEDANRHLVEATFDAEQSFEVVGYAEHRDAWRGFLEQDSDVVVVACRCHSRTVLSIVRWAVKHRPDRPVVVVAESVPEVFVRDAFKPLPAVAAVFKLPLEPQDVLYRLRHSVAYRKSLAQLSTAAAQQLIAVLGPKGGGKTLIAANLAVALADRDLNVVLVDLDLQSGNVGLQLGLSPERTVSDLMRAGPPFDHETLERYLTRHSSGVKVLLAPTRPDHASGASIDDLRDIYASLRAVCDAVIVDTPPRFSSEVIATIEVSSAVCVVGSLDSIRLKNMTRGLSTLDMLGYSQEVTLVLNRADARAGITIDDFSTIIGRTPDVLIPDHRRIRPSITQGTPIVASRPRSKTANAFRKLADRYDKLPLLQLPLEPGLPPTATAGVREPRRPVRPNLNATSAVDPADYTDLRDETGRPDQGRGQAA